MKGRKSKDEKSATETTHIDVQKTTPNRCVAHTCMPLYVPLSNAAVARVPDAARLHSGNHTFFTHLLFRCSKLRNLCLHRRCRCCAICILSFVGGRSRCAETCWKRCVGGTDDDTNAMRYEPRNPRVDLLQGTILHGSCASKKSCERGIARKPYAEKRSQETE